MSMVVGGGGVFFLIGAVCRCRLCGWVDGCAGGRRAQNECEALPSASLTHLSYPPPPHHTHTHNTSAAQAHAPMLSLLQALPLPPADATAPQPAVEWWDEPFLPKAQRAELAKVSE